MTFEEAYREVLRTFPFEGYIRDSYSARNSKKTIVETVTSYIKPPARILDFGCGPCDKTAILQHMGYECFGHDDLSDHWHTVPGVQKKILHFAAQSGVEIRVASGEELPYPDGFFDMIMMHDVLEHLHDSPRVLLNRLLKLAKPEGFLFLSMPNAGNLRKRLSLLFGGTNLPCFDAYYWCPGPNRGHVREYVRSDLVQLADFLNLDTLKLAGCDRMLHRLPLGLRIPFVIATYPFRDLKDTWLFVGRKPRGWEPCVKGRDYCELCPPGIITEVAA